MAENEMTLADRIRTVQVEPTTMKKICEHLANGGSMIELCKLWEVPYGAVMHWVHENPERSRMYDKAMQSQMYWAIDRVMDELKRLGTVDISEAYNADNSLKPLKDMPEGVRRAIVAVETEELFDGVGRDREMVGYTKRIKVADKIKALELIGKKFAMWIEKKQFDTSKSLEQLIEESIKDEATDDGNVEGEAVPGEE